MEAERSKDGQQLRCNLCSTVIVRYMQAVTFGRLTATTLQPAQHIYCPVYASCHVRKIDSNYVAACAVHLLSGICKRSRCDRTFITIDTGQQVPFTGTNHTVSYPTTGCVNDCDALR